MSLADYQTLAVAMTRDDAGKLSTTDRDSAIARAVAQYGRDRPRTRVEDVTAAATNLIALPSGWQAGFSALTSVETPVGEVPPVFVPQERMSLYTDATQTTKLMLLDAVAVGATLRMTFTVRHVVDATTDTIPDEHREAVCAWAAALLCDQLAALYSNTGDSTLQADSVDHGSRPREFANRAKQLRSRYHDALGLDPKRNAAAGVVVDLDMTDSQGGDRLYHGRTRR